MKTNLEMASECGATAGVRLASRLGETTDFTAEFSADQLDTFAVKIIEQDRAARQAGQEPSMTVAFDEGVKEPRIVSWNKHPTGTYWLYAAPQPAAPEGYTPVAVKGLDDLVCALERAESKGYLPDAVAEEWAAFDYRAF